MKQRALGKVTRGHVDEEHNTFGERHRVGNEKTASYSVLVL